MLSRPSTLRTLSCFAQRSTTYCRPLNPQVTAAFNIVGERLYSSSNAMMFASREELKEYLSGKDTVGNDVLGAMEALSNADVVCFDVDSTVINEEGIDVLADSLGKGKEVAELTAAAMTGTTKFEDALAMRLDLLKPSLKDIEDCLEKHPLELTEGVEEFIESLLNKGVDVYLVSGGFRIMIEPVAQAVCVAKGNIYANTILFDDDGNYAGFDANEPTSADMGKPKALTQIKEATGAETMIMIGDGATDAQAKPPADAFIGFGGVAMREAVKEKADWYVMNFKDMTEIINKFHKK
mmetsp:Transcript_21182/g.29953  ORF Transcript_21182/g.29953 Transcript_21182/m.29953 type:complete len:295 (-) Transcript_21182:60-944(-)